MDLFYSTPNSGKIFRSSLLLHHDLTHLAPGGASFGMVVIFIQPHSPLEVDVGLVWTEVGHDSRDNG